MIRAATPDEAPALYSIYRDAARGSQPHYTEAQGRAWAPDDDMPDWWPERLAPGLTWVAERDGTPVGFVTLTDAHLDFFFVAPALRGQGIASALYDHFIERAVAKGHNITC